MRCSRDVLERWWRSARVAIVSVTCLAAAGGDPGIAQSGAGDSPARRFLSRLERAGRAEAAFSRTATDPLSGKPAVTRGEIALEPPDRLLLGFAGSGERIAIRGDGGEWVQPRLRQMLTLDRSHAEMARQWWSILLGGEAVSLSPMGGGRWRARLRDAASDEASEALVTFDQRGFPVRLDVDEFGTRSVYRFSGWRFAKARGRTAFTIRAPEGYEVVALP